MDLESSSSTSRTSSMKKYRATLLLAYQSLGVVYGDLSTSPIYVYKSTFAGKLHLHEEDAEILGVLSLVFWTLTLIALCKYTIFVLGADDNGEGGTFALYSLMCRRSKMGLLVDPNSAHENVSTYRLEQQREETRTSLLIKKFFERHHASRTILLLFVLLGTSMVIGDGVLTPSMSVLSAVSGLRIKIPELHENYTVFVACFILMGLFALQHYGTHRVGFLFAPILISWLGCITMVGIYNIIKWNPGVIRALSPYYIYNFFKKSGRDGWSSLGGLVLCITGAEAMFADLGHFSRLSIRMFYIVSEPLIDLTWKIVPRHSYNLLLRSRPFFMMLKIAFTAVVYPCLVVAYMGEAAYLSKNREDLHASFFKALPESVFWPVFVIATLATIVGSQAIISATFSIIGQCRALGCFPRVKIIHTSSDIQGQIYIPEVNWILMLLCLSVTIGFRDTDKIGNANGLAVVIVMFVTTCLMFLIITTVWKRSAWVALLFIISFGSLELLYLTASLAKAHHGGWLPLIFSMMILLCMYTWHYGTSKKQAFELQNKVSFEQFLSISPGLGLVRLPGVGLIYSNIATGVPPMFAHFVTNFPAFHRILIFVSLQTLMVPKVPLDERFLIGRIGESKYRLFRCIIRYGYKDKRFDSYQFESQLLLKVAEFLQQESLGSLANGNMSVVGKTSNLVFDTVSGQNRKEKLIVGKQKVRFVRPDVHELSEEWESGVSYMMGNNYVLAHESSPVIKKIAINVVYSFLRRNSRSTTVALGVPNTPLIEVGMVYHV